MDYLVKFNAPNRKFDSEYNLHSKILKFIKNGPYLNGDQIKLFEKNFAELIGSKFCHGVSSGTSAIELAILALNLDRNSEILMTANAGAYGSIASIKTGMRPRYFEIDENGLPSFSSFQEALTKNSKAVILTHLYGQAVDIQPFLSICKDRGVFIIEDCAHSVGASYPNSSSITGSQGHLGIFSFYPTKNLSSIGDSGAIVTSDELLSNNIEALRQYGWTKKYFSSINGGSNFRMDDLHALIINHKIKSIIKDNARRLSIWSEYKKSADKIGIKLLGSANKSNSAHLAVLKLAQRDLMREYLESNGIETAVHYPYPDYLQPSFNNFKTKKLIHTENHCNSIISLPLYAEMTLEEINLVASTLQNYKDQE
jgi:dTDP-4-amino-4,6-dideoxygalactose transaminase